MEFVKVSSSDYTAIYLNGKLLCQGHSLDATDILSALNHKVTYKYLNKQSEDLNEFGNSFPETLEQLKGHIRI